MRKKMRPARGPRSVLCLRELYLEISQFRRNSRHLRCRRNDVAMLERVGELLSGHETGSVSDVCHKVCPVLVGDLAERSIIPIAGIR